MSLVVNSVRDFLCAEGYKKKKEALASLFNIKSKIKTPRGCALFP